MDHLESTLHSLIMISMYQYMINLIVLGVIGVIDGIHINLKILI